MNAQFIYATAYSISPLRCLIGSSNSKHPKFNFSYTPNPVLHTVFTIAVSGNSILPAAQDENLGIILNRNAVTQLQRVPATLYSMLLVLCNMVTLFSLILLSLTSQVRYFRKPSRLHILNISKNPTTPSKSAATSLTQAWPLITYYPKNNQSNPFIIC